MPNAKYWSAKLTIRRITNDSVVTVADLVIASDTKPDLSVTAHRLGIHDDPMTGVVQEGPTPVDVIDESLFIEQPTLTYDGMKVWRVTVTDK